MKIILTGATGTAGSAALQEALKAQDVTQVTVLTRRPTGLKHSKLVEIIHEDFTRYESLKDIFADHDGCLWCLGIAQSGLSEARYTEITYTYAIKAARAMGEANSNFIFCFLSGQGADSKEKSRILFARVKGRAENALLALGKPRVFCFRPGYIHSAEVPAKGWAEKYIFKPTSPFFYKFFPGLIISARGLGRAMLKTIRLKNARPILENDDIYFLSGDD
jgi:uncharacterized protein YbjT (DUF2867 family)